MTVPELGWGDEPVRVCKNCFKARNSETEEVEGKYHYPKHIVA